MSACSKRFSARSRGELSLRNAPLDFVTFLVACCLALGMAFRSKVPMLRNLRHQSLPCCAFVVPCCGRSWRRQMQMMQWQSSCAR